MEFRRPPLRSIDTDLEARHRPRWRGERSPLGAFDSPSNRFGRNPRRREGWTRSLGGDARSFSAKASLRFGFSAGMEAANGAIEHDFHNALVPINGSHSGSSGRSTPNGGDPAPGKLFVGGLSWQTSSEKLREYFGMFGTVTDVLIMKDPVTQRSRGFGFITFAEPGSVDKVLKCPIHTLDGKKIDPKHATPKNRAKQANRTKKIFVGGVSQDTSSEEVKAYFNQFGKVEETVMLMDQQTKRHRGFGFVTFENEDVVDRVCEIHFHTIKNKKVECKKAQPKEAVQPGALSLGKRVVLGTLGVRLAPQPPLQVAAASQLVAAQAQAQASPAEYRRAEIQDVPETDVRAMRFLPSSARGPRRERFGGKEKGRRVGGEDRESDPRRRETPRGNRVIQGDILGSDRPLGEER
ncbi:hypothetical protein KM043_006253 [Ampulex compressa]|nr:hypothetical protein KM043_006253 [Ampulex compressa]